MLVRYKYHTQPYNREHGWFECDEQDLNNFFQNVFIKSRITFIIVQYEDGRAYYWDRINCIGGNYYGSCI